MIINRKDWSTELVGKQVHSIRPQHVPEGNPMPSVVLGFTDRSCYTLTVLDGVFFESCLINTLRKSQPIEELTFDLVDYAHTVEAWADTFPLFQLTGVNRSRESGDFPFVLEKMETDHRGCDHPHYNSAGVCTVCGYRMGSTNG